MKHITYFLVLILCLSGCRTYDIDEILLQREDISLTVKGNETLVYEPKTFQLGYNEDQNEFRVFDDNLGNWFVLKCNERPSTEGQILKATLKWTTTNTTKTKNGLTFTVKKTDSSRHIWLWCEEEAIGVVVREL